MIIVPTKYYSAPTEIFRTAGISVVIWANHMIRASVVAMQTVAKEVYETETLTNVEDQITSVNEIFRLQGADELARAEQHYFKSTHRHTRAIVLAATRGQGLESMTAERPKVMLPVAGKPVLQRLVDTFKQHEVHPVTAVGGYKADSIDISGVQVVYNPNYANTGELASLVCAFDTISEDTVISYGDLLIRQYILRDLLDTRNEIVAVVDSALPPASTQHYRDLAYCSRPNDYALFAQDVDLLRVDSHAVDNTQAPSGRWVGMLRVRGRGHLWLKQSLKELQQRPDFNQLSIPDLLNFLLLQGRKIKVLYIHGHWLDVNNLEDLGRASDFTHGG